MVARWLGHSSIQVTMRYLKLERDAFAGAADVLEPERVSWPTVAPLAGKGVPLLLTEDELRLNS